MVSMVSHDVLMRPYFTNIMLPFLFYSLVSHVILTATKSFSLCIVISVYSSVIGILHLGLMLYVCYSLAKKKASIPHCLIRKYHNLKACVVATGYKES